VQPMIAADAAGVAFTVHPVTGDRDQTVITAVPGIGERLVAGEASGEEWIVSAGPARTTPQPGGTPPADPADAVATLAREIEVSVGGPQDIEWAIAGGRAFVLQARPMTAVPDPAEWTPPEDGCWMRNFRLGEWLPEPVTPLFADWLLPLLDRGTA